MQIEEEFKGTDQLIIENSVSVNDLIKDIDNTEVVAKSNGTPVVTKGISAIDFIVNFLLEAPTQANFPVADAAALAVVPSKGNHSRGVRQTPSGKFAAEIRDPAKKGARCWLETFATAEQAALANVRAAFKFRGRRALLNFPNFGAPERVRIKSKRSLQEPSSSTDGAGRGPQRGGEKCVTVAGSVGSQWRRLDENVK
ncbi:hypothetical protein CICLE_v10023295mg [Citrus x clementina]|uniref:AP2/ERF domain-containing protein n=2 Tax=Citrus TaxID=2706 RepID=V4TWU2_CITCL|nr:hypothetical protein CICLE_v10023295mg [Citrus x clementina]